VVCYFGCEGSSGCGFGNGVGSVYSSSGGSYATGEEGLIVQEILDAIYESARTGEPVAMLKSFAPVMRYTVYEGRLTDPR